MEKIKMWDNIPGMCEVEPELEYYPAEHKTTRATVICFPGGGYSKLTAREGTGIAEFFNSLGMDAFVCRYRVFPHLFPLPLLDARRAVRCVRANADIFGIDADKIAVIGCSAGGHLVSLVSTYGEIIEFEDTDEIDKVSPFPNATILCYPVIHMSDDLFVADVGSFNKLLGEDYPNKEMFSTERLVNDSTPPAFIWCTSNDRGANVINCYLYAKALREHNIPHEMHIFPIGGHGLALAPNNPHIAQWTKLLKNWLSDMAWL
ncbi:MAG: alpha/beta hydrolase [Ruminococcaceae bacterium]|nr:alpha/beta hydrolase [Oscillospiraceae bacterium]